MKNIATTLLALILLPTTASANEARLDTNQIEKFYSEMAMAQTGSIEKQIELIQKHLNPNGQFKIETITEMPEFGAPPQAQTMDLNKDQVIEQTRLGAQSMQVTTYQSKPTNINISPDGKSAIIQEHSSAKAVGDIPTPNGSISVKMEVAGTCNDQLSLNKGIILVDQSHCKITTIITPVSKEL